MKLRHILIGTALATATCNGAKPRETGYQNAFLSNEHAHTSIELTAGYSLEPILSEPYIQEPVA